MSNHRFERSMTSRKSVETNLKNSGIDNPFDWKEALDQQPVNVEPARSHLNGVSDGYFDAIGGTLEEAKRKLLPLKDALPNPRCVVSVGVGNGKELHALAETFESSKIIGLDLSSKALDAAKRYLSDKTVNGKTVKAELIESSAVTMSASSLRREPRIDGFIFSAIMHEIYSYVEDGKKAWKRAIEEAVTMLAVDGCILLRDFAAPEPKKTVAITCKTDEAKAFYQYFRERFRTFEFWDADVRNHLLDKRSGNEEDYPPVMESEGSLYLPLDKAAELLLHFRNYERDKASPSFISFDLRWKEIDERYLPFDPGSTTNTTMPLDTYVERVITVANEKLKPVRQRLILEQKTLGPRAEAVTFLRDHFALETKDGTDSDDLFQQIPQKMELVFRKIHSPD